MARTRSYRLLCPIARALDQVGDRWSLLILRDLHAGPARFSDLFTGLEGLASNLLTTRLQQLQDNGLVAKRAAAHGAVVYELTENGERTAPLLFELARFGSHQVIPGDVRPPGNLRTLAVTLKEALRRVVTDEELQVEFTVDDEPFSVEIEGGKVSVRYEALDEAPLAISTEYEALVATVDRRMTLAQFSKQHVKIERGTKKAAGAFFGLMGRSMG
jgi:DNA-binding HxlR family transcriptional regulator